MDEPRDRNYAIHDGVVNVEPIDDVEASEPDSKTSKES